MFKASLADLLLTTDHENDGCMDGPVQNEIEDIGSEEIEIYDLDPENLKLDHLPKNIQNMVKKLLTDNIKVFATTSDSIGKVPYDLHHSTIEILPDKMAYTPNYKKNPKERKILKILEEKLVRIGVLLENDRLPPNRSPNLVVKKPHTDKLTVSTARFVTDLRKLNAILAPETTAHGCLIGHN